MLVKHCQTLWQSHWIVTPCQKMHSHPQRPWGRMLRLHSDTTGLLRWCSMNSIQCLQQGLHKLIIPTWYKYVFFLACFELNVLNKDLPFTQSALFSSLPSVYIALACSPVRSKFWRSFQDSQERLKILSEEAARRREVMKATLFFRFRMRCPWPRDFSQIPVKSSFPWRV